MNHVTSRSLALELLLAATRSGASLDELLPSIYESELSGSDKGFARQLLMVTLRHHGQLEALVDGYLDRPLEAKLARVGLLLRMGAAQLLILKTPAHAAIDTSVQQCKQLGLVHQAGMVNAVLRKIASEQPALGPATYNLPSWLKGAWRAAYGKDAADSIAEQCLAEPPLDLFYKPQAAPQEAGLLPQTVRLGVQGVTQIGGYDEGDFWVQDVAATLPVRALGDVSGKRVLDMCAAPGGKTLQLCAGGAQVTALDRSEARLRALYENLERCQFNAEVIRADATLWQPETGAEPELLLLDAPCSATGTARRHPDLWLRKKPQEVGEMVAIQRAILSNIMRWLPQGAQMIYAVCSLQPEEGEQQIDWLLEEYPQLSLEPFTIGGIPPEWSAKAGTLRTLPHYWGEKGGMDGFFIAKLRCGG